MPRQAVWRAFAAQRALTEIEKLLEDRPYTVDGAAMARMHGMPGHPDIARMRESAPELYRALRQCLGVLCEAGDLNNYRNLTDEELGRVWIATARQAGNLLNKIDGLAYEEAAADG